MKTAAANHRVRFDSVAFRQSMEVSPNGQGSPDVSGLSRDAQAYAGSSPAASAKVSVVRSSDSTGGCQRSSLTAGRIHGPVAQGNESATLRRSRSHVQIVPDPPIQNSYGVAELERRESLKLVYVGSNPTSVASLKSLTRSTLES